MEEPSLPRELQLIVDDIVKQNVHLLEWEVFGNITEDMRIVMTWRRIEVKNEKMLSRNRWKLNQSSIDIDENLSMKDQERLLLEKTQNDEKSKLDKKGLGKKKSGKDWKSEDKTGEVDDWQSKGKLKKNKLSRDQKVIEKSIDSKDELQEDGNKDVDGEKGTGLDGETEVGLDGETEVGLDGETEVGLDGETEVGLDGETEVQLDGIDDSNKLNGDGTGKEDGDMDDTSKINGNLEGTDQNIGDISDDLNATNANNLLGEENNGVSADGLQTGKEGENNEDESTNSRIRRKDVDFEGIEIIKPKSQYQALKMMQMQREVFRMTLDETGLDFNERKQMHSDLFKVNGGSTFNLSSISGEIGDFGFKFSGISQKEDGSAYEYKTSNFQNNLMNIRSQNKHNGYRHRAVMREILPVSGRKGWEGCLDCQYNDFCDNNQHKDEYIHMLFADSQLDPEDETDCSCNVCKGGAVHNGCFYRELLRLKTEYRIFDKRNYCYCSECIPFKYRKMCLRQELKMWRKEGQDNYYRLTFHEEDGIVRYHSEFGSEESLDSNYHSDEQEVGEEIDAMNLDDIDIEITQEDKVSFIECGDCQCNGFCDDIRHKKLYLMLLRIDDEDFEELDEQCNCLVCEYDGAAHSGCVDREIKRLRYDLMLFDVRNLCRCHECVPFKYRRICLRQQMKIMRKGGNNIYDKV